MNDIPDAGLLERFTRTESEAAFAELVRRHLNLVHSVALRHTDNPQHAQEITQAVFIILARKAASLGRRTVLSGWLYHTARLTAANFRRAEFRRVRREQEAFMQSTLEEPAPDAVWPELAPLLDEAMARLGATDRDAVVLRYFENKSLAEVGTALGVEERAAQKRVTRALEKLRKFFTRRGVTLTTTLIAGAVAANSVQAAPVGLAVTISAAAVKGSVVAASTLTLVKGALKIMAWTKAKTAILTGAIVILAGGTATVAIKEIKEHNPDDAWRVAPFDSRALSRARPQVRILPSRFSNTGGWGSSGNDLMGIGVPASALLMTAYHQSPARTLIAAGLPPGIYDYIAKLPKGSKPQDVFVALQQEIKNEFGLVGRLETRDADVLLLKVKYPNAEGLKPATNQTGASSTSSNPGRYVQMNEPLRSLANNLEGYFQIPVIDRTGLTNTFDIQLTWDERNRQHQNAETLKPALLGQLGLELVPRREKIEMLVVGRVQD